MFVPFVLLVSDLAGRANREHILKQYEDKRNLPVSRLFFLISRLTAIPNVVFSPPINLLPYLKGSSCTLSSSFIGWPSQTTFSACKRFVPPRAGWER